MNKNKKILVTGATGFVGSHMVDFLIKKKNYDIYVTKRYHLSKLQFTENFYNKVKWIDCDLTDPISTEKLIKKVKPSFLFHFAAESFVSPSWDHPHRYMSVNYNATVNLLDSIRKFKLKTRFFIPGSGEEYGEIDPKNIPINEETALNPVNPYAVSKVAQDLIGYVYFKSYNLNVIRCRTFNHEGPRRENVFGLSSYAYQIARIEKGYQKPIIYVGRMNDKRNFTHIEDVVEAYWIAINECKPGELYLIGNEDKKNIFTFKEALLKLIKFSNVGNVKIKEHKPFVRPTDVPRLIVETKKFSKISNWKPKISFDKILLDTLNYWRYQIEKSSIYK